MFLACARVVARCLTIMARKGGTLGIVPTTLRTWNFSNVPDTGEQRNGNRQISKFALAVSKPLESAPCLLQNMGTSEASGLTAAGWQRQLESASL
eukprot:591009-Rhodomonas_salina.1